MIVEFGCNIKRLSEASSAPERRISKLIIAADGKKTSGNWRLVASSSDPENALPIEDGLWFKWRPDESEKTTLYIADPRTRLVHFEFYNAGGDFSELHCGSVVGGTGRHLFGAKSDIAYSIWFGCA